MCMPDPVVIGALVQAAAAGQRAADLAREWVPQEPPTFIPAPPRHCDSCGAPHALDEKRCSYCLTPC